MAENNVSWMGEIPSTWKVSRIGNAYTARNEKVSDLDYPPLSVTMKGVVPQLATAAKSNDHNNRKLVKKGDFCINSRSDRRGSCGISPYDGSVSLINTILEPREEMVPGYYEWLFHTSQFADEFYKWGHGIVDDLWTTSWSEMKRIIIPVPTVEEQMRIACYLDARCADIDKAIEDAEAAIEDYKLLKHSIISQAVTKGLDSNAEMIDSGIPELGRIPKGYSVASARWLIEVLTDYTANGSFGNLAKNVEYKDSIDYARLVRLTDLRVNFENDGVYVNEHAYNYLKKSELHGGEILLANVGAYAGLALEMPAIDFRATLGPNMFLIWFNQKRIIQHFAFYALNSSFCKDQLIMCANNTTAQPKLNKDNFKTTKIVLPPISDQKRIIEYLDRKCPIIDKMIQEEEELIKDLHKMRSSMIFEVVTGKRRVM